MVMSAHAHPPAAAARDSPARTTSLSTSSSSSASSRVPSSYSLASRRVSGLDSYRRSSSSAPDSPGPRVTSAPLDQWPRVTAAPLPPDPWPRPVPGRTEAGRPTQRVVAAPPPSPTTTSSSSRRRDTRGSVRHAERPSNIEPRLYRADSGAGGGGGGAGSDADSLTDEEVLSRYRLGALHFSAQYDLPHGRLLVRVIEARELPRPSTRTRHGPGDGPGDGVGVAGAVAGVTSLRRRDSPPPPHSNPYVKLCLLPDQKNSRQTGVRRKTQDPLFEERYSFELPFVEAQRRTLALTVLDFDKLSRHRVVGKVAMPLAEVDLVKGGHWWKPIVPSSQSEVELGELLVSLNYLPSAGRLNVEIVRAKQLLQTDMAQGSDPFARVQLVHALKVVKSKRTACIHGTVDPFYNESFSFHVTPDLLDDVSLVLTVFGRSARTSSELIGRVVLGRFPSGAPELTHWRRAMASPRTPVAQWHSLRSRGACDRVSPASLAVT